MSEEQNTTKSFLCLFFDGSCFPTGSAAYGAFVVKDGSAVLHQHRFLETEDGTNNIAEWAGLVAGLRYVRQNYSTHSLHIFGDSQLVIYQLTGKYACKKEHLMPYLREARQLLDGADWQAEWLRRDKNTEADALSKIR